MCNFIITFKGAKNVGRDFLNFLGKVGVVSLPLGIAPFGLLSFVQIQKQMT